MHKGIEGKMYLFILQSQIFKKKVKEEIASLSGIFFSFLIMKNNLIWESQLAQFPYIFI